MSDADLLEEVELDELPDEAEHQPLLALARVEGVAVNPDHHTTDCLG